MLNNTGVDNNDNISSVTEETEVKTNSSKKIRYSYNPQIIPGMPKDVAGKKSKGWQFTSLEWDHEKIKEMIRTQAYIGSELKDGHKTMANVKGIYNIILDFDSGHPTLTEFLSLAKSYRFYWIAHTTLNHQKPKLDDRGNPKPGSAKDKFRVIIPLSEPISEDALTEAAKFWCSTKRFPTLDPTSFQGNRYFMVNPDAEVHIHDTWISPMAQPGDAAEELDFVDPFEAGMIPESFRKNAVGRPRNSTSNKNEKLDGNFSIEGTVKKADGSEIKIKDITEKTQIFCPFCNPEKRQHPDKPNAFLEFNKAGQIFLYCSSEHKTYWSHSSEIIQEKSSLFFNDTVGYPCRIKEEDPETKEKLAGYVIFKNNDDWVNYCNYNTINPTCKTYLPRVRILFNPSMPGGLNKEYYNMFQESEYLLKYANIKDLRPGNEILCQMEKTTPVIYEILMNLFGEQEYLKNFLNWNAVILRHRIKLDTAWLITSKEEGIGKGLMFDRILQPLYGKSQSLLVLGNDMDKKFNAQDQTMWLKVFDEVYAPSNARENLDRKEWLKHIITARGHNIEPKGVDAYQVSNHINLILYSNNECPIFLGNKDRRFSVIRNLKAKKIELLPFFQGRKNLQDQVDAELDKFTELLLSFDCDIDLANTAVDTSAKNKLKQVAADEYEEFAKALTDKDASFFMLEEVFPLSANEKMFNPGMGLSSEGGEVESAIQDGYILAKNMNRICKFHFSNCNYKNITARLKLKGIERTTKKVNGLPTSVYLVR